MALPAQSIIPDLIRQTEAAKPAKSQSLRSPDFTKNAQDFRASVGKTADADAPLPGIKPEVDTFLVDLSFFFRVFNFKVAPLLSKLGNFALARRGD